MRDLNERIEAIPDRLEAARERIARVASACGREPDSVRMVAVTKSFPLEMVRGALAAGITDIGENRVQEGREKIEQVGRDAATWHLIGHLQTNKAKWAVRYFDLLHSVDSVRLAQTIQERAEVEEATVPVLIQVNTSAEESKYGLSALQLRPLLDQISAFDRLRVEGLMTLAPFDDREQVVRPAFVGLRGLFEEVPSWGIPRVQMTHLSMGMSNDFEWAVAEGATMVRLGSVLFGARE